jgi:hypothetical protein
VRLRVDVFCASMRLLFTRFYAPPKRN